MDNFLIKTLAINPVVKTDDDQNDFPLLVLAGEKDNASYMVSPNLVKSDTKPIAVKVPVMPNTSFEINKDASYISKVIPLNVFEPKSTVPDTKTAVEPFILFGKNMSSSNDKIVFPDDTDTKFTSNTQKITGQNIMIANIMITTKMVDKNETDTSSVFYTVPKNSGTTTSPMANYIDNSNNYSSINYPSFQSDYTFMTSTYNLDNLFGKAGDLNDYKATKDGSNHFNFSNATNNGSSKNKNKVVEIVVPVVVVILLILLLPILFFITKGKKRLSVFRLIGRKKK